MMGKLVFAGCLIFAVIVLSLAWWPAHAQVQLTSPSNRSEQCSLQADALGLHGSARHKYRAKCMRGHD